MSTATTFSSTDTAATDEQQTPRDWHTVARVVMPEGGDEDTLALYVDGGQRRLAEEPLGDSTPTEGVHSDRILDRFRLSVPEGERTSFATYFNAFPASYWRQWTVVKAVRLVVRTTGTGSLLVYRSNGSGRPLRVAVRPLEGDTTSEIVLDLKAFGDGGWYWFDLVAADGDVTLDGAQWQVDGPPVRPGSFSIGITTFNRTDYCLSTVQALGRAQALRERLDRVYVIDQGTQRVEDEPGWDEAAAVLGDTLRVVHQANMGGSGGFARGMYESAMAGESAYHLLLDDDVNIEPEGIARALDFAGYCRVPTLVGGHMFDLHNRSVLHSYGEELKRYRWFWGPVEGNPEAVDLALNPLRSTPFLHRRTDVDYNGWWMTLVPTDVIREIGLALPVFIKWDDAEYGLRAGEAGYPTVSLPGAAVWHVSWTDKDDTVDWQAYYHERNRILTALLHSNFARGGRLLRELAQTDLKLGVSARYYAQEARLKAVRDILEGPQHLHETIATTLPELRALMTQYDDSRFSPDPDAYPLVNKASAKRKKSLPSKPTPLTAIPFALRTTLRHLRPVREESQVRPEALVPHRDAAFWVLSAFDSAVVTKADGTGAAWHHRDPQVFRAQLTEAAMLRARLVTEWDALRERYRAAFGQFVSFDAWEKTFGIGAGTDDHERGTSAIGAAASAQGPAE